MQLHVNDNNASFRTIPWKTVGLFYFSMILTFSAIMRDIYGVIDAVPVFVEAEE